MTLNMGSILQRSAAQHGRQTALIDATGRLTYAELDRRARGFAGDLLERGLGRGQKVAIMVPNSAAFTIAYYATLYAGGTVVALCTLLSGDEVEYQLDDSEAEVLVLSEDFMRAGLQGYRAGRKCGRLVFVSGKAGGPMPEGAEPLESLSESSPPLETVAQTDEYDTAVIMYTSGTAGHPKGAELTHANLYRNAVYCRDQLHSRPSSDQAADFFRATTLAALPLYHSFGQTAVQNGTISGGGIITYISQFAPVPAAEVICRDKVTTFFGVPTMYIGLLSDPGVAPEMLVSLKTCVSGGAPLPVEVKREWHRRLGIWIREGFGLTETSPVASFQSPQEASKAGSVGKPIEGVEFRIVDENDNPLPSGERGELCIRGYNVMKGYYKNPEATAKAIREGWFHSGDVAYMDKDGDYHIVDRTKDMILRGGFNVYSREVEEVLHAHPAVREAAVIGVPDEKLGEEVKAVVVLMEGARASREELIEYCRQHVAAYKYPRIIEFREDLPKGPTGKVLKRDLRLASADPAAE